MVAARRGDGKTIDADAVLTFGLRNDPGFGFRAGLVGFREIELRGGGSARMKRIGGERVQPRGLRAQEIAVRRIF
jgi:hypothetical protein